MKKKFSISIIILFLEVVLYNNSFTQSNPLSILDSNGVHLRVAAAQFQLQPDLDANLKKINHFLDLAIKKNVDLIVFPELALTGYPPRDYTSISYIHQDTTEKAMEKLQAKAKKYSIAISIGVGWKDENGTWRNRAYFIDDKGEILEYYDKVQQTSHERKFFADGNRLPTFEWKGVRLGMLICMDMRYPELWRLLRKQGAGLVLHLLSAYGGSTWKIPVLTGTIRGHAASNGYYIVSCNNAGPAPMVNSAIYNPRGMILTQANFTVEQLIYSDIVVGKPGGFVDFKDDVYMLKKTADE